MALCNASATAPPNTAHIATLSHHSSPAPAFHRSSLIYQLPVSDTPVNLPTKAYPPLQPHNSTCHTIPSKTLKSICARRLPPSASGTPLHQAFRRSAVSGILACQSGSGAPPAARNLIVPAMAAAIIRAATVDRRKPPGRRYPRAWPLQWRRTSACCVATPADRLSPTLVWWRTWRSVYLSARHTAARARRARLPLRPRLSPRLVRKLFGCALYLFSPPLMTAGRQAPGRQPAEEEEGTGRGRD